VAPQKTKRCSLSGLLDLEGDPGGLECFPCTLHNVHGAILARGDPISVNFGWQRGARMLCTKMARGYQSAFPQSMPLGHTEALGNDRRDFC
jgi:hypothetical protein